jgi:hypothetical protein
MKLLLKSLNEKQSWAPEKGTTAPGGIIMTYINTTLRKTTLKYIEHTYKHKSLLP